MKRLGRDLRGISPVLAVLMMIAVAIAGSLVVYAWIMGYIDLSTERSGESITIQSISNDGDDLLVYVQNVGEGVVQLEEDECLYVNGVLVDCIITGVTVSDNLATLSQGETATLRYVDGAALPGEKVKIKVTTLHGTPAEKYAYPAGTAHAPPGSIIWNQTYGGTSYDFAWSVIETPDDGYALAGYTQYFGSVNTDFWLVKTDELGNMEWNRTYGGLSREQAYSLVETVDGGYALAGRTWSFGAGGSDVWLVKTDEFGNMEWNRTYGGLAHDGAYSLVAISDGGFAIAGYTRSFGDGSGDFWLIRTDSHGNDEWNGTYGGTGLEEARSLVTASDGGYAMAGFTNSSGSHNDFWLVKTDASGNAEWNRTYGGLSREQAYSLVETVDGGYALAGNTLSFGTVFGDFWLVKTDADGTMEWSQTYGGPESDRNSSGIETAYSLVVTSDGGYTLAGSTESSSAGGTDFLVVKTDESGNMEWSQTYGGTSSDSARSIVETSDGGYIIAGSTSSFGAGSTDFWLIKTN